MPVDDKHHMSSLIVAREPLDSLHFLSAMRQQSSQSPLSSSMLSMTASFTFNLLPSSLHERPTFSATKERKLSSGGVLTDTWPELIRNHKVSLWYHSNISLFVHLRLRSDSSPHIPGEKRLCNIIERGKKEAYLD